MTTDTYIVAVTAGATRLFIERVDSYAVFYTSVEASAERYSTETPKKEILRALIRGYESPFVDGHYGDLLRDWDFAAKRAESAPTLNDVQIEHVEFICV